MKRLFILFLVSVTALCSCRSKTEKETFVMPEFPSRTEVDTRVIVDFLPCNLTYGIWESGGLICALYFDYETETLVHLFDKKTGRNRGNYIHRGRGPLEMPPSLPCISERDGVIYMTDFPSGKSLSFDIQRLAKDGVSAIQVHHREYNDYVANARVLPGNEVVLLNNKGYMNKDTVNYHRVEYYDENNRLVSYVNAIPYSDPKTLFYLYQQSIIDSSPDCKHLILGSVWGGLLELYSLPDLKHTGFLRLADPAVSIKNGIELTSGTTSGLRDIVAKDKGFYAVIGVDVPLMENWEKAENEKALTNNDLYYFNWRGKPIKHFETDCNLEKICITKSADTLYSIVSDITKKLSIGVTVLK